MASLFKVCALIGVGLWLFGISLWFIYEALHFKFMFVRCVPPTVYSSIALGGIPVVALGITHDRPKALVSGINTIVIFARVVVAAGGYLLIVDSVRFARAHMHGETLYDDINKEIRNPIVLVQWLFLCCYGMAHGGRLKLPSLQLFRPLLSGAPFAPLTTSSAPLRLAPGSQVFTTPDASKLA